MYYLKLLLKKAISIWHYLIDYSGFGASFVKAFIVSLMLLFITYPVWSYPFWLKLSMMFSEAWQVLVLMAWLGQWGLVGILGFTIEYLRKPETS